MRLFKDPVEISIDILSDILYFTPAKPTLVFGKVCVEAHKKLQVKSFTVALKGQMLEIYIDKYRLGNKQLGNHLYNTVIKNKFEIIPIVDIEQILDTTSVPKGITAVPFEMLVNLEHETIKSRNLVMEYQIEVKLTTKSNNTFKFNKPILFYKLLSISRMNYFGGIYYNYMNYELNIPDKLFLNHKFHFDLNIMPNFAKTPTMDTDLSIRQIEVDLMQCCKLRQVYNYTENHEVYQYQLPVFETLRFRILEINHEDSENADNLSYESEIFLNKSYMDQFGNLQTVHPSYRTQGFECSHKIRLLIEFANGSKFKIMHPINIHHSNDVNGIVAPPVYSVSSPNAVLVSNLLHLPPAYDMIESTMNPASLVDQSVPVTD